MCLFARYLIAFISYQQLLANRHSIGQECIFLQELVLSLVISSSMDMGKLTTAHSMNFINDLGPLSDSFLRN